MQKKKKKVANLKTSFHLYINTLIHLHLNVSKVTFIRFSLKSVYCGVKIMVFNSTRC